MLLKLFLGNEMGLKDKMDAMYSGYQGCTAILSIASDLYKKEESVQDGFDNVVSKYMGEFEKTKDFGPNLLSYQNLGVFFSVIAHPLKVYHCFGLERKLVSELKNKKDSSK